MLRDRIQEGSEGAGAVSLSTPSYDYIILTAAITRPDLHTRTFPGYLRLVGTARVKWLINVDDVHTGHSVKQTIDNLTRILTTAPNIEPEFLQSSEPGCFFRAARRLALRAGQLLSRCRTGIVWLEDDWQLAARSPAQKIMRRLRVRVARSASGGRLNACPGDLHEKQAALDRQTRQRNSLWFVSLVPRNVVSFNPGIWSKDLFARSLLQTLSSQPADRIDDPETLCADPWNRPDSRDSFTLFVDPAYQDAGRQWNVERGLTKWEKAPGALTQKGSVTYATADASRKALGPDTLDLMTGYVSVRRAKGFPRTLLGRIAVREGRLTGHLLAFPHVKFDLHPAGDGAMRVYMHRLHPWTYAFPYKKVSGRIWWEMHAGQIQLKTHRGSMTGSLSRSIPLSSLWLWPLQATLGTIYYAVTLVLARMPRFDSGPEKT